MRLYSLQINEATVCQVDMDTPDWFPVRPRLNNGWLRAVVKNALRSYFSRVSVQPK